LSDFDWIHIAKLLKKNTELHEIKESLTESCRLLCTCYLNGGKVLTCGNGGSASDAEHIVAELMKSFLLKRPIPDSDYFKIKQRFPAEADWLTTHLQRGLPAISLVSQNSLTSAIANDTAPEMVYAQQVYSYGQQGDILLAITTSGNAQNVINAAKIALSMGINVIALTGASGGKLSEYCDVLLNVPAFATYEVQEYHVKIYHALCADVEAAFFRD
jgi:D-sedoheptulose 7-phosphate isomerase